MTTKKPFKDTTAKAELEFITKIYTIIPMLAVHNNGLQGVYKRLLLIYFKRVLLDSLIESTSGGFYGG